MKPQLISNLVIRAIQMSGAQSMGRIHLTEMVSFNPLT